MAERAPGMSDDGAAVDGRPNDKCEQKVRRRVCCQCRIRTHVPERRMQWSISIRENVPPPII